MSKIMIYLFVLSICYVSKISSQTSNIGGLTVSSNTILSTIESFDNKTTGDFVNDGTFYVYANFNNDGLVTFSPNLTTGLTYFKGSAAAQTISGVSVSELYNARFENNFTQPAFLLSGDITVFGSSDFYYGIVDNVTQPGNFLFEENATHQNTSNNSYVAGLVERNKNNQFEFPIGDGGFFRPSAISQSNATTNFFSSRYYLKDSNALHPHNQKDPLIQIIDLPEYWSFESNQNPVDIAITLSWNEATTPNEIINGNPGTTLAIVRWDETENKWVYYTSAVDESGKTVTASIDNDGIFTLGRILSNSSDEIVIHNAISANEDGKNDFLQIDGITNFPNNRLQIYNRWGIKVFETTGYGIDNNFFYGYSEGRATVKKSSILPDGTYFYTLSYEVTNGIWKEKAGYIYLTSSN
ncbi:gliding motility-associated C-terminal domain-containing protein [Flavobacterium sp. SORGH_AS_0622]|jgi:gliding motility-associated-like protein|uniref:T9SS type B sorting domain-containing protein n=1 Tax=Flavobacterium sp. SORGH_AS_0622 TaxID=3041772 RepID=UPI00278B0970|nr:gliding motility-associated C-terminal domain-containing protein [Flavobacterium sp. SORGH_AS_0622]MDQ1165974.1 gliding motility-associated-like protein [Flavobacterium sp. SORGH_AS_0622]